MEHLMTPTFDDDKTRISIFPTDLRKELYLYARSSISKFEVEFKEDYGTLTIIIPDVYESQILVEGKKEKLTKFIAKAMRGEEAYMNISDENELRSSDRKSWVYVGSNESGGYVKITPQLVYTLLYIADFYSSQEE